MRYKFGKIIVIALGGSVINPAEIDVKLLKEFRKFILKWVGLGKKFIIVAGGGAPARDYQKAGSKVLKLSNEDKDWLGIHATRLNAHLLRTVFFKEADPMVIDSRFKIKKLRHKITIASGWRPGWSTDYIAIRLAEDFGAKEAINASNISHVYPVKSRGRGSRPASNGVYDLDRDHPFLTISWKDYRKMIPARWVPGFHSPIDPVGAKLAHAKKIKAIIVGAKNLKNFDRLLDGRDFEGTIIK